MDRYQRRQVLFRPISVIYFAILLLLLVIISPFIVLVLREVLALDLGLPPEMVAFFLLFSLLGSFVNVPLARITSHVPMFAYREVSRFGVLWYIPGVEMGARKTLVTVNVGGALVPLLVSLYILGWSIPRSLHALSSTYLKILVVLTVVTIVVNRTSRLVKGLGIATPALIPPLTTAIVTLLIYSMGAPSSPTKIAYVGGTLGTLIGADLLNLRNVPKLGAPVVSIGGAGTFDGVYTTGLLSVLLVLLL